MISIEAAAALVGLSPDDECDPEGIDWGYTDGPADGAPVFLKPGWSADDGQCEVHYPDAESGAEAAQEYVEGGDWGESDRTSWIDVYAWQVCLSVDSEGRVIRGRYAEGSHTITIEPDEPECADGEDHDWQSPHDIVGGIASNPGVWGSGGGVVIHECCMQCGASRVTDTWAQNPETGEQGLRSVSYEPGKYADEIPSREMREMRGALSCETLADAAAYVLARMRDEAAERCLRELPQNVARRAHAVADYVLRAGNPDGYWRPEQDRARRLALRLATARDERERRAAEAVIEALGYEVSR